MKNGKKIVPRIPWESDYLKKKKITFENFMFPSLNHPEACNNPPHWKKNWSTANDAY